MSIGEVIEIEVEYRLLKGGVARKTRSFPVPLNPWGKEKFPENYKPGGFISQTNEEPQGMFIISAIDRKRKKFILNEVDCDPIHWKGDEKDHGHGPNEKCRQKKCPFYNDCPISAHLMMTADID